MSGQDDLLRDCYRYCQGLTRQEAKNFYYGFVLLPPPQRRAICAVYAFSRRCDDIVDGDSPPQEKEELLQSYRRELDRCLSGQPQGPIFTALHDAINRYQIPHHHFHQLIDGVQMDLTTRRYPTFDHLRRYCYLVASVVGLITIEICGYRDGERARQHAADLGLALQLTNILRDLSEDAARDRIYIPLDEIAAFGYSQEELLRGEQTEAFYRLMTSQAQRAREYFRRGRDLLPLLPRRSRACVAALASIYQALLDRIEASDYDVFRQRVALSSREKLTRASRALVGSVLS
ncbi:MAG: presqualene diphosphate synthase HpnD [Dehalococcoidia bacterium]